jgi:hypothetical protein
MITRQEVSTFLGRHKDPCGTIRKTFFAKTVKQASKNAVSLLVSMASLFHQYSETEVKQR